MKLILSILTFLICIAFSQGEVLSIAEKDGVLLEVTTENTRLPQDPIIDCIIKNATDESVPFEESGATRGFYFRLLDAQGVELPQVEAWRQSNGRNRSPVGSHGHAAILPGEATTLCALRIAHAYGPGWTSGVKLEIEWDTGSGQGEGRGIYSGPFTVGDGIKGIFNITPLVEKADPAAAARNAAHESPVSPSSVPSTPEVTANESSSDRASSVKSLEVSKMADPLFSRRNLLIGLTLGGVLLIGLVWVVAERRSPRR